LVADVKLIVQLKLPIPCYLFISVAAQTKFNVKMKCSHKTDRHTTLLWVGLPLSKFVLAIRLRWYSLLYKKYNYCIGTWWLLV